MNQLIRGEAKLQIWFDTAEEHAGQAAVEMLRL